MTSATSRETPDSPQSQTPPAQTRTVRYGTGADGRPAVYDMTGCTPHMLISGSTGTGLTTACRIVLVEAARQGTDVRFCCPKPAAAAGLHGLPGISIATDPADMTRLAEETRAEMLRRYQAIEEGGAHPGSYQQILLALDDCEYLACATPGTGKTVMTALDLIACFGRSARISVLAAAHAPGILPPGMIENLGTRLVLGRPSRRQAQALFGDPAAGHDVPPGWPGAGIAAADGPPVRVQVHWPGLSAGLPPLWAARRARTLADWLHAARRRGILARPRGDAGPAGHVSLSARWPGPPRRPGRRNGTLVALSPASDEAAGFLYLARTALRGQRAHLAAAGDAASGNEPNTTAGEGPGPSGPCIGVAGPPGGERVYLFPLAAYQAASSMAADLGAPFTLTYPQLEAVMRDSGLLQCEDSAQGRRHTVRRRVAGGLFRVWDLPADAVLGDTPAHGSGQAPLNSTGAA